MMVASKIIVKVRREGKYQRETSFGVITIPEDWHAEVVSGVWPCKVAGIDFYPYADGDTPDEAVELLVDQLRQRGHTGRIKVLGKPAAVA